MSTYVGNGAASTTEQTGTQATIHNPLGVAIDPAGNVYATAYSSARVVKIAPGAVQTYLAGSGVSGYVDAVGTFARFHFVSGITFYGGYVFVTEHGNNDGIRMIDVATSLVSTRASRGQGHVDSTGAGSMFYTPWGITADANGILYVADHDNSRIRRLRNECTIATVAGAGASWRDGPGSWATFNSPYDIVIDPLNSFAYVADLSNNRIRAIDLATQLVTTLAGSSSGGADGVGSFATFAAPSSLALNPLSNTLFVTEVSGHRVRMVSTSGVVSTLAGSGTASYADGTGTAASFYNLRGIAIDDTFSTLFVSDSFYSRIRAIAISTAAVTTFAGSGSNTYADGVGSGASFNVPWGLTLLAGTLYVADSSNHRIRAIVVSSQTVSTLAGSGVGVFGTSLTRCVLAG